MGWLASNIFGGIVRWGVGTLIAAACLVWGFAPAEWLAEMFGAPPSWVVSPWTRLAVIVAGVIAVVLIALWGRWRISVSRIQPDGAGQALLVEKPKESAVKFWLPGDWEPPIGRGAVQISPKEAVRAEEIKLRIEARQNLKNVRVKIRMYLNHAGSNPPMEVLTLGDEFSGTVTKGMRVDIIILQRKFRIVAAQYNDEKIKSRIELGLELFPGTDVAILTEIFGLYIIGVDVFHEEGPDSASFAINTGSEPRPLTIVDSLHNVERLHG